jgi:hypothetical protein
MRDVERLVICDFNSLQVAEEQGEARRTPLDGLVVGHHWLRSAGPHVVVVVVEVVVVVVVVVFDENEKRDQPEHRTELNLELHTTPFLESAGKEPLALWSLFVFRVREEEEVSTMTSCSGDKLYVMLVVVN